MTRFNLSQPGDVLKSVYDLELSEEAWITDITQGVGQSIDGGIGTLGALFRLGEAIEVPVLRPIRADDEVPHFIRYLGETQNFAKLVAVEDAMKAARGLQPRSAEAGSPDADFQGFSCLFADSGIGTLSFNRADEPAYQVFRRTFAHDGVLDAVGLIVPHHASRSFLLFTARQLELSEISQRANERWIDLQNHIGAVYDLRTRLRDESFEETDAVWFDTSGSCVEAGPGVHSDIRERLRNAVLVRESSRLVDTASKRVSMEAYWSNVMSGKWAILDRFDTDGRRPCPSPRSASGSEGCQSASARCSIWWAMASQTRPSRSSCRSRRLRFRAT
jgi:hypothetical protein